MESSASGHTYEEIMKLLEKNGCVGLGILAFNVETEAFEVYLFEDQNPDEVNALLAKIMLRVHF